MAGPVVHPRVAARRGAARATRWWGKAWVRAVEEAAYAEDDLARARALSRSGRISAITTRPGEFVAAVEGDHGLWTVAGTVPVLDGAAAEALVETVAAESGRVAALLGGDLPHDLVEHAEESGVELLPYGGELGSSCPCEAWVDPCVHALAVLYQLAWLVDADPFVLLQLRGLPRDELLARLHQRSDDTPADDDGERDVEAGLDAALRAARVLDLVHDPEDTDAPVGHLF
ncbi:hypothetical protein [Nocardioides sp. LS1]|uniref:SWIM zinc finger family protein n=1 Tax=Nocardioides sp. LS1 TaxID=1027620 RepID=UPI000F616E70|nr:hypothetical protein [Nocardioides sp. LS1]GCD90097.1 hypothetical protein NLS1_21030 [Nocardioides sp. LS1]